MSRYFIENWVYCPNQIQTMIYYFLLGQQHPAGCWNESTLTKLIKYSDAFFQFFLLLPLPATTTYSSFPSLVQGFSIYIILLNFFSNILHGSAMKNLLVPGAGPVAEWLSLRAPLQAAQCFVGSNPGCGHGTAHQTTLRQPPTCPN